jgi:hypothetical protein
MQQVTEKLDMRAFLAVLPLPARAQIALHNFQLNSRIAQFPWVFERMRHVPKKHATRSGLFDPCINHCLPSKYLRVTKSLALVWISVE